MLIETDPSVVSFSERPGTVLIGEHNRQGDFLVRYADRNELFIAADPPVDEDDDDVSDTIDASASLIRALLVVASGLVVGALLVAVVLRGRGRQVGVAT